LFFVGAGVFEEQDGDAAGGDIVAAEGGDPDSAEANETTVKARFIFLGPFESQRPVNARAVRVDSRKVG
jgi:hypothetical protein